MKPIEQDLQSMDDAESLLFDAETMEDLPSYGDMVMGDSGADVGILLQHGFSGSNIEMTYIGNYLARHGFRVLMPLLPGHGSNSSDFLKIDHQDWTQKVKQAIIWLKNEKSGRKIVLAGHSLGGALSFIHATNKDVSAVISIAGPVRYPFHMRSLMKISGLFETKFPYDEFYFYDKRLYNHPGMKQFVKNYGKVPLKALNYVGEILDEAYQNLPEVDIPVCLIYSKYDTTVPPYHVGKIVERLKTADIEVHWLSKSHHIMVIDEDRNLVCEKIHAFLSRILHSD